MYKLKIISSTTRPGRKGPLIAAWVEAQVRKFGEFEPELIDLGELNLPMMDEPNHPSQRKYVHEHTKNWSRIIDKADAFIFVTGEYNYSYPAPLKNALDYLSQEWAYKAAGIVSYGGISGGTRAYNRLKADIPSYRMMPLFEAVHFPFFEENINEKGVFDPKQGGRSMSYMLKTLLHWTKGMEGMREEARNSVNM